MTATFAADDESFHLDTYLRNSKRMDLEAIKWQDVRRHPFAQEELKCLTYMMDIESHTIVFLRDLLATRTAEEPDITAFLSCWAYEEFWHGEAFSRLLGEANYTVAPDNERARGDATLPSKIARNAMIRATPGGRGYGSFLVTIFGSMISSDFPALHMAWGAINELSVLTAYRKLLNKSRHPVLVEILGQITKDEARHYAFYRQEAERRLKRSRMAQKLTRFALQNVWEVVGSGVRPQAETDFVVAYLFGDEDGLAVARKLDEKVAALPGLEGLKLFEQKRADALRRVGPVFQSHTPHLLQTA